MNILLINQPVYNRGDEAAHRSLVRGLNKLLPQATITIILENIDNNTINQIKVNSPNNLYVKYTHNRGYYKMRVLSSLMNFIPVSFFALSNYRLCSYFQNADVVICAPGGICLGGFYNWNHLYMMLLSKYFKKHTIYYSRSIGPFTPKNWKDFFFIKRSIDVLSKVCFLSLRDSKSMKLADSLGLKYIKSIDTAFLDVPEVSLPKEISTILPDDFIVFVPNQLTWHHEFVDLLQTEIDDCYLKIIEIIADSCDKQIVMLPQLYNGSKNDYNYFLKLKNSSTIPDRIIVINDSYSSDIQQCIIEKSKMIIGARYHSIIFGINKEIPIIALNYEHKIEGVLEILGVADSKIDFKNHICVRNFDYIAFKEMFLKKLDDGVKHSFNKGANQIASNCLLEVVDVINSIK